MRNWRNRDNGLIVSYWETKSFLLGNNVLDHGKQNRGINSSVLNPLGTPVDFKRKIRDTMGIVLLLPPIPLTNLDDDIRRKIQ